MHLGKKFLATFFSVIVCLRAMLGKPHALKGVDNFQTHQGCKDTETKYLSALFSCLFFSVTSSIGVYNHAAAESALKLNCSQLFEYVSLVVLCLDAPTHKERFPAEKPFENLVFHLKN